VLMECSTTSGLSAKYDDNLLLDSKDSARSRGLSLAGIVGSNPAGEWSVLLSCRFLCDGPIPCPEEFCGLCVCNSHPLQLE